MNRRAKILLGLAMAILIALIGQFYVFIYSYKQREVITFQNEQVNDVQMQIDQLFISQETGYLVADIEESDIQAIYDRMLILEAENSLSPYLVNQYNDLLVRYFALNEINSLYQNKVIDGDRVHINSPFVENLDEAKVQQINMAVRYLEVEDPFQTTINSQLDYIVSQVEIYNNVLAELEDLAYIPLESANFNLIARAMAEAETAYSQIQNPTFTADLDAHFQTYAQSFMQEIMREETNEDFDFQLVAEAVQPSNYLGKIVQNFGR